MGISSKDFIITTSVLGFIALASIALRIYARKLSKQPFQIDDYVIFLGGFFLVTLTLTSSYVLTIDYKFGDHTVIGPDGLPSLPSYSSLAWLLVSEATFNYPVTCAKISLLCLYRRIFNGPQLRSRWLDIICFSLIGLILIWCISTSIAAILRCVPITVYLNNPIDPSLTCINATLLYWIGSLADVVTDAIILVIPIPLVWRLRMSAKRKLYVIGIFLLGALATAVSLTRFFEFRYILGLDYFALLDFTYELAPTSFWSVVTCSLSITAANLPTYGPFLKSAGVNRALLSDPSNRRATFKFGRFSIALHRFSLALRNVEEVKEDTAVDSEDTQAELVKEKIDAPITGLRPSSSLHSHKPKRASISSFDTMTTLRNPTSDGSFSYGKVGGSLSWIEEDCSLTRDDYEINPNEDVLSAAEKGTNANGMEPIEEERQYIVPNPPRPSMVSFPSGELQGKSWLHLDPQND